MPGEFSYPPAPQQSQPGDPPAYGAMPPRPPRSGKFWLFTIGGCLLGLFALMIVTAWGISRAVTSNSSDEFGDSAQKIAVVDINGVIISADKVNSELRKMADKDNVKAIVLHINSPGGGAAASQEIYNEILRLRREKKLRFVASVESVGASGAYYIASACDKIYANDASVVGSIGVIMEWVNYGDLMRWAKLKNVVLKAGELKDAGNPSRDLTPKEQAYFQSLIDNMHTQFIHDVATGRGVPEDKIKPLATGQVWTGQQAKQLGLIDVEGGFHTAVMDTAKMVGIKGEPGIIRPPKKKISLFSALTDDADDLFPNPSNLLNQAPGFYFMWK
ncbi:MAG: signal peptide peptidase SppA [Acidobacteria bacterium]|nr:signal peptide peptidase SppA [Acidobacteriota bacterium]